MANLPEQQACILKHEALDRLKIVLAGTDVSSLWTLMKDIIGTASETGLMYVGEPPCKHSQVSSITSDSATEEDMTPAVLSTSASLHSVTSTPVCPMTPSQYDSSVTCMRPRAREDANHIGLPEELIPTHTNFDGKSLYPCRWIRCTHASVQNKASQCAHI